MAYKKTSNAKMWKPLTSSSPIMQPLIRGSAMGDRFPKVVANGEFAFSSRGSRIPWKSGYMCRSFVNSVRVSTCLSMRSFSSVSSRTWEM